MTNLEMFYFTGKCLTLEEHPEFREEIIEMADSIDWEKFVALCSNHLILPVIYLKFKSHDILKYLPEELSGYLKEIYNLNLTRNNQILEQLREVNSILNIGNVYPVFLKGAGHLLDGLYSDTGERIMGDIDFLVPEKDYLLSAKLLQNTGYLSDYPAYLDIESMKHYPRLYKADVPADLEIHRIPVTDKYQSWFNPELIGKEKKSVSTLDGCYVISDKHNIILNFIHGQLHHGGHFYGIVSYRDLYDLYLLSKRSAVKETIPEIKTKQKAIAYFVFAGKALGLNDTFYPKTNLSSWLFIKKHDLNLSSKAFYLTNRTVTYITQRILIGHTNQIIKSFYSGKMRQSIVNRLLNRSWYIEHLKSYTSFFSPKK